MSTTAGVRWQRQAVCARETPDAPELWTPDRRPERAVRTHLQQMCRRCPVRRRCAENAVSTAAESGIYAGIWVPERVYRAAWESAVDALARIADETLAVTA